MYGRISQAIPASVSRERERATSGKNFDVLFVRDCVGSCILSGFVRLMPDVTGTVMVKSS